MLNTRLKMEIIQRCRNQCDLAEKIGMDEYTLSRVVRRRRKASLGEAKKIAKVLGSTVSSLFTKEDIKKN
jgi:transcriptional regulator with XRE-family HTH domain